MKTIDFDYDLPKELIAQKPIFPRDRCRLLVIDRQSGALKHRRFFEIEKFLKAGDVLVLNDTKVFKARLYGKIKNQSASWRTKIKNYVEIFLLRQVGNKNTWEVLAKPGRKLKIGSRIRFAKNFWCEVKEKKPDGRFLVRFNQPAGQVVKLADKYGHIPVPPYIKAEPANPADYQTVYAKHSGSVAAPTAGFHFTPALLRQLKKNGVQTAFITLHVGYGTFKPIKTERIEEHRMEPEWVEIPKAAAEAINRARKEGRRVAAAGTTVVRALEGAFLACHGERPRPGGGAWPSRTSTGLLRPLMLHRGPRNDRLLPLRGEINLFIYPGFKFKVIDALITNFHLPKSTLLLLVSAFAGRKLILRVYQEAIKKKYRFYSFGDAMMII